MATLHSIRKSLIKKENLERFWKDLYPYQQDGIQRTMNDIEDNFKGQIILPTGSGKTRIMEYLTGELINKYNDICSFAVFCHRIMLANNLLERIVSSAINKLEMKKLAIITMHSGDLNKFAKNLHNIYNLTVSGCGFNDPNPQIRFANYRNYDDFGIKTFIDACVAEGRQVMFVVLYHSMKKLIDTQIKFDFAFYDEAHTTCSNKFLDDLIPVGNHSNINLFFTATPTSDRPNHDMNCEEIYGKKIIELYPKDLINGKYICPIKVIIQDLTNKKTTEIIKDPNSVQSAIESIKNGFISLNQKIIKDSKGTKKSILFVSVKGNKYLKEILNPQTKEGKSFKVWRKNNCVDLYITSAEIKGEIDFYDKDDNEDLHNLDKEDFIIELNKIDGSRNAIVINIDQLSEGIDVPNMNGAMFLRGEGNDPAKFIQFIGRCVRRANEDRKLILDNNVKWDDEDKFIKPCAYVYIAQSYLEDSVTKETLSVLDKIYSSYGDIIFRGTYIEDLEGTKKNVINNPSGKVSTNNKKTINGFENFTSYQESIKDLLKGLHMTSEEKIKYVETVYKNLCDRSLTNEANEIKNDLNEIAKNTNYEEEFNDLAYELITNKYKHIFEIEF